MRFPCPCCGHVVLDEPAGSYDICPNCGWEDDDVQLRYPYMRGGANSRSLFEAQREHVRRTEATTDAKAERFKEYLNLPAEDERVDEGWRPLDPEVDGLDRTREPSSGLDCYHASEELGTNPDLHPDMLYYWRSSPRRRQDERG